MKPLQHKKHTLAKRGFSLLCVLALCLGLLPVTALAAAPSGQVIYVGNVNVTSGGKLDGTPTGNGTVIDKSSPVSYLDENGTDQSCNDYEVVTADDTQWTTGWYVVNSDVTINQRIPVNGDVKLILTDGHTLTVNGGIHVTGDDRFTVYGQENGTGKLTATATNNVGAGIGGNGITTTSAQNGENGGTIIIAGGIIEAVGGDFANDTDSPCGGAGIGNGNGASNGGSVTVYGGEVNATGGVANAGIGGDGSTIQILGGTVEATSGGGRCRSHRWYERCCGYDHHHRKQRNSQRHRRHGHRQRLGGPRRNDHDHQQHCNSNRRRWRGHRRRFRLHRLCWRQRRQCDHRQQHGDSFQ